MILLASASGLTALVYKQRRVMLYPAGDSLTIGGISIECGRGGAYLDHLLVRGDEAMSKESCNAPVLVSVSSTHGGEHVMR